MELADPTYKLPLVYWSALFRVLHSFADQGSFPITGAAAAAHSISRPAVRTNVVVAGPEVPDSFFHGCMFTPKTLSRFLLHEFQGYPKYTKTKGFCYVEISECKCTLKKLLRNYMKRCFLLSGIPSPRLGHCRNTRFLLF